MNGEQARVAFERALALVKAGQFEEARKVEMLPSDRAVIEKRISAASANRANTKENK